MLRQHHLTVSGRCTSQQAGRGLPTARPKAKSGRCGDFRAAGTARPVDYWGPCVSVPVYATSRQSTSPCGRGACGHDRRGPRRLSRQGRQTLVVVSAGFAETGEAGRWRTSAGWPRRSAARDAPGRPQRLGRGEQRSDDQPQRDPRRGSQPSASVLLRSGTLRDRHPRHCASSSGAHHLRPAGSRADVSGNVLRCWDPTTRPGRPAVWSYRRPRSSPGSPARLAVKPVVQ